MSGGQGDLNGEAAVRAFLRGLALEQYAEPLVDEGFDDMRSVWELTEADLQQVGCKPGHARRLLAAVKKGRPLPTGSVKDEPKWPMGARMEAAGGTKEDAIDLDAEDVKEEKQGDLADDVLDCQEQGTAKRKAADELVGAKKKKPRRDEAEEDEEDDEKDNGHQPHRADPKKVSVGDVFANTNSLRSAVIMCLSEDGRGVKRGRSAQPVKGGHTESWLVCQQDAQCTFEVRVRHTRSGRLRVTRVSEHSCAPPDPTKGEGRRVWGMTRAVVSELSGLMKGFSGGKTAAAAMLTQGTDLGIRLAQKAYAAVNAVDHAVAAREFGQLAALLLSMKQHNRYRCRCSMP